MKALVTGANGFLGLYVVEQLLARGDRVRAMCRGISPQIEALGAEIVRADLRDRAAVAAACQGVDVVFHVGGMAGMGDRWQRYYEVNVLGTRHVVEGCLRHGVGRLVFTSSPSVTFDGRNQEGIDESAPYPRRWLCHYAHTKAVAEQHVLAANGRDGLLSCALRPHLIWGPRDRHLVPGLLERAAKGWLRRIGDGRNLIDTVYVENAAAAHLLAADALKPDSPVPGQAYFISQGEPVNCWAWIDALLALAGLPPVQKSLSRRAAWLAGTACEAAYRLLWPHGEPPLTRFLAAELSTSHYFNIGRARRDLGYEPKVSMAEGMRRLAAAGL
jgi:nucleoside-diphosphate-sugar epimerase